MDRVTNDQHQFRSIVHTSVWDGSQEKAQFPRCSYLSPCPPAPAGGRTGQQEVWRSVAGVVAVYRWLGVISQLSSVQRTQPTNSCVQDIHSSVTRSRKHGLCIFERYTYLLLGCFCFSDIPPASFMVDILRSSMMGEEGTVKPLGGSEVRNKLMIINAWSDFSW